MKKRAGKLTLARETVRNLVKAELGQAAGGTWTSDSCTYDVTSAGRLGCYVTCIDPNNPIGTESA